MGCCSFAFLFDDINVGLSPEDQQAFATFAHAQVSVVNELAHHLIAKRLLFCPTEYCASFAVPNVAESSYLRTVGAELDQRVQVCNVVVMFCVFVLCVLCVCVCVCVCVCLIFVIGICLCYLCKNSHYCKKKDHVDRA